ncbi:MAG TPA: SpoIIE family protein phosphatase [Pyrinomonadaceae bacterium]|jgi:sigma-B regulation protein RsbU (phosphoserine phosphatase)
MKNRKPLYLLLLVLFAIAATVQVRYTIGVARYFILQPEATAAPFYRENNGQHIKTLKPEAERAGLQTGDRIVAINGKPFTGEAVWIEAFRNTVPGQTMNFTVERNQTGGAAPERKSFDVSLVKVEKGVNRLTELAVLIFFGVLMPNFCMLLGFWVAFVRPRDPLAWLVLALMLSFGTLGLEGWAGGSGWWLPAFAVYRTGLISTWPIWMLLFGIYFPERFTLDRKLPWLKWLIIVPLALSSLMDMITAVVGLYSFELDAAIGRVINSFEKPLFILALIAVGSFFAALATKSGTVKDKNSKRRLRLLYAGASVGLAPSFIIIIIGIFRGQQGLFNNAPLPVALFALFAMFLFPLSIAYVIVVQRAMDVRMVIRQGMQYALARNGVRVLQFVLAAATIIASILLVDNPRTNRPQKLIVIGLSVVFVFLIRRGAESLRAWTDRRFFREAYNAEQILSDLSENVRTMVETQPLLETVAQRISESLHVRRVALLLKENGAYRSAHALGYEGDLTVAFMEQAATVVRLRKDNAPLVVYADDPDSWIHEMPDVEGEREMLEELDTQLLLPLNVKEKLPGFISLGPKQSEEPYSNNDLRLLQSVAAQTGLALENSQLTAAIASEVAQRERLNREVEIAREVQERLFPQEHPTVTGLDYCGACRPALGVGGDYYDFLLLPNENFGIAVGDVSGKGISAALLMASLQASLRGQAVQGTNDLARLMGYVNRLVYDASSSNRYATFFYAQYEPQARTLSYVNAGHNPPMIFRQKAGEWEVLRLEEGGCVVGLLPNFPYTQASVTLQQGDLLIAFTDGISEAMNPAEEEWGEERMMQKIKECHRLTAADMLATLVKAADEFASGAKQHDDMTLVVIRVV